MSLRPTSRAEGRKKHFKKAIDADESRRKREDTSIRIRKTKVRPPPVTCAPPPQAPEGLPAPPGGAEGRVPPSAC